MDDGGDPGDWAEVMVDCLVEVVGSLRVVVGTLVEWVKVEVVVGSLLVMGWLLVEWATVEVVVGCFLEVMGNLW